MTSPFFCNPRLFVSETSHSLEFQEAHEWISAGLFIAIDIAQEKQNWLTGRTELAHRKNRFSF